MKKFVMENHVNSGDIRSSADNPEPSRKKFKEKPCKICKNIFTPTAPCNLFCPDCIPIKKALDQEKHRKRMAEQRLKSGKPVGCGKGGSNKCGKDHPAYRYGFGFFRKTAHQMKQEIRYCERCGKDLLNAGRYQWCVHHIDHNRKNNVRENYMLLCKRCHQLEHNCAENFRSNSEGATTIPEGSRE